MAERVKGTLTQTLTSLDADIQKRDLNPSCHSQRTRKGVAARPGARRLPDFSASWLDDILTPATLTSGLHK